MNIEKIWIRMKTEKIQKRVGFIIGFIVAFIICYGVVSSILGVGQFWLTP